MPFHCPLQKSSTLLLVLLLLSGCNTSAVRANYDTPRYEKSHIKAMIKQEAARIGVPISLGLAVAKAESDFNPYALSSAGARGVMQIMPATAEQEYGIHRNRLWEPRLNIRLGLHSLKRLINRYRGRVDLALSYYNGGSAVGDLPNARIIPATYGYVRKVMRLQRRYQRTRT
jgi:soluble lytic murein transglycosylase-like protein